MFAKLAEKTISYSKLADLQERVIGLFKQH